MLAKVAEIGIMLLGHGGVPGVFDHGLSGLLVVLFLMGTHSAFFGPGKYGILPELFRRARSAAGQRHHPDDDVSGDHLRHGLGGLLGTLLADRGQATENPARLWVGSAVCVLIAVVGTLHFVARSARRRGPSRSCGFNLSSLSIPPDTRAILAADRPLMLAHARLVHVLVDRRRGACRRSIRSARCSLA